MNYEAEAYMSNAKYYNRFNIMKCWLMLAIGSICSLKNVLSSNLNVLISYCPFMKRKYSLT